MGLGADMESPFINPYQYEAAMSPASYDSEVLPGGLLTKDRDDSVL